MLFKKTLSLSTNNFFQIFFDFAFSGSAAAKVAGQGWGITIDRKGAYGRAMVCRIKSAS